MSRYHKYTKIAHSLLISKYYISSLSAIPFISRVEIQAGHFKIPKNDESTSSRSLLLTNLSSSPRPIVQWFTHGKKMKVTFMLISTISSGSLYWALDKVFNLLLPNVGDLKSMFPRNNNHDLNYYFRINKPFELPEWDSLFPVSIKQVNYFPFFLKVLLRPHVFNSNIINCSYLRMYRIPFQNPRWKN